MNALIDRYLSQAGITPATRPALRDAMRFVAEISAREEKRRLVMRLASCPEGTLVSDLSLAIAHDLSPLPQSMPEFSSVNAEQGDM